MKPVSNRAGAFFALALGVGWIVLSVTLSLSRVVTAVVAGIALVAAAAIVLAASESQTPGESGKLGKWWRALSYRNKVNVVAGACAAVTLAGAGIGLLSQPIPDDSSQAAPRETTTTTTHSSEAGSGKDGESSKTTDSTVTAKKESVDASDDSLLGKAVDNSMGVVLVRLGLALLAAFITGLIVQRIALGKYGVKLPFGLGEFEDISDEQTSAVTAKINKDEKLREALSSSRESGPGDLALVGDPRIGFITLRGQLENRLRAEAVEMPDVNETAPIDQLIDAFASKRDLSPGGRSAIQEVIELGNQAAHGAEVEPGAEQWLAEVGQYLPEAVAEL